MERKGVSCPVTSGAGIRARPRQASYFLPSPSNIGSYVGQIYQGTGAGAALASPRPPGTIILRYYSIRGVWAFGNTVLDVLSETGPPHGIEILPHQIEKMHHGIEILTQQIEISRSAGPVAGNGRRTHRGITGAYP